MLVDEMGSLTDLPATRAMLLRNLSAAGSGVRVFWFPRYHQIAHNSFGNMAPLLGGGRVAEEALAESPTTRDVLRVAGGPPWTSGSVYVDALALHLFERAADAGFRTHYTELICRSSFGFLFEPTHSSMRKEACSWRETDDYRYLEEGSRCVADEYVHALQLRCVGSARTDPRSPGPHWDPR